MADIAAVTPAPVAQVAGWLEGRFGGAVTVVDVAAPANEGFDSEVHLVRYDGAALPPEWRADLVLRVKRPGVPADEARREEAVHTWLVDRGEPVPRILAVLDASDGVERPTQVMERVPGTTMLAHVQRRPWTARRLTHRLAELHVGLHDLGSDGFPATADLLDHRLRLPRRVVSATGDRGITAGIAAIEERAPQLRDAPLSVCHGDFHPLNVLVAGSQASIIDWTDAGLGDRHGDVAHTLVLFDIASIVAKGAVEARVLTVVGRLMARSYHSAYAGRFALDEARVALWRPVHLLHAWSQSFADADRNGGMPARMQDVLRRQFDEALSVS